MAEPSSRSLCIAAILNKQPRVRPSTYSHLLDKPQTCISEKRRQLSLSESSDCESNSADTVLYLAYGSNLCDATFLGNRGIKPLAATNVLVPELRLTFDLPGVPYNEPCFANTARRHNSRPDSPGLGLEDDHLLDEYDSKHGGYNKDKWHKGLVGTVYEVTKSDYATIIKTEGGGSSYHDVLVNCYPLSLDDKDKVPQVPQGVFFRAHTLFAQDEPSDRVKRPHRPDPAYAQASARYLGLITEGAKERGLPLEYRTYLDGLQPYTPTTQRQKIGKAIFTALWLPIILSYMQLGKQFADARGRYPAWVQQVGDFLFTIMWALYDAVYKPLFGDGERTIREDERA